MTTERSLEELTRQAEAFRQCLAALVEIHGIRDGAWRAAQGWLNFATAVLAALTAAGVIAEAGRAATIMAVVAAVVSAANVALKPDERRDKHRGAADSYGVLRTDFDRFIGRDLYSIDQIDSAQLDALWGKFEGLQTRFHKVGKEAPTVNRALRKWIPPRSD